MPQVLQPKQSTTTDGSERKRETMKGNKMNEKLNVEQWLAIRKQAGLEIDQATAEVDWCYGLTLDPYGIYPDLPEEYQQVGREYFARAQGATYGCTSAISRTKPVRHYGNGINPSWHSLRD
jgi:hypothetical protein